MPRPGRHRRGSDSPLPKPESQLQAIMRSTCSQITLLPVFEDAAPCFLQTPPQAEEYQKNRRCNLQGPGRGTQTASFWSQVAVFVFENNTKQHT